MAVGACNDELKIGNWLAFQTALLRATTNYWRYHDPT